MTSTLRFLACAATLALAACGGGTLTTDESHIRLLNATSAGEFVSLDLFAANSAAVTGVLPDTVSGYADLKSDTYTLDLRQTGSSTALVTMTTTLAKKDHQTVVASTSGGTLSMTLLSDQEGAPSNGNAKVRIFNAAATDAGAVDVYFVAAACTTLATSAAAPTIANVSGLQNGYTQVTASATPLHLCVTATGDKSDVRLDVPALTFSDQRIITVILTHTTGGLLLRGLVLDQQGAVTATASSLARVRIAASLVPAGPVDVNVNGTPVAAGLTSPAVGPYQLVTAGPLVVLVNGAAVTPAAPLSAAAGADVTLLVTGTGSTVTQINDDTSLSPNTARPVKLRLVNALNGAVGTATLTVDNALVGSGATFATASAYATLPASAGLARVEARSGAVQYFLANNVTLATGHVYSLFLLGDIAAAPNVGQLVADR
ncbi:MAG TPA: DUF4397 domain-containing protein [Caldimonas sp.]|jgi:hypothetical protein|nr:DUF4397 domain-containing protein [Caldimonas sp.]